MFADVAVLPVHGDAGEVPHMLIGAGQLIEEGGFSAILVSRQPEGQCDPFRNRAAFPAGGIFPQILAHARMLRVFAFASVSGIGTGSGGMYIPYRNLLDVFLPQGQLISP